MAAGRVVGEAAARQRIFYGGVEPDARREVWKFLLGLYTMSSTAAERAIELADKRDAYARLKDQWTSISPAQRARCLPGQWLSF